MDKNYRFILILAVIYYLQNSSLYFILPSYESMQVNFYFSLPIIILTLYGLWKKWSWAIWTLSLEILSNIAWYFLPYLTPDFVSTQFKFDDIFSFLSQSSILPIPLYIRILPFAAFLLKIILLSLLTKEIAKCDWPPKQFKK